METAVCRRWHHGELREYRTRFHDGVFTRLHDMVDGLRESAPEELDMQVPDKQCGVEFQLFTSLLRFGSGWFANHALQRLDHTTR